MPVVVKPQDGNQGKGVTVNTISPGYIGTKMVTAIPKDVLDTKILPHIPVGRLGKPEEYASLARQIVENEMLNGETIRLDGAIRMAPR